MIRYYRGGFTLSALLDINNLSLTYHTRSGETKAINDISLSVNRGDFISIVGPSGCGKSTLLSLICGLLEPTEGQILINDEPVSGTNSLIGYMFQKDELLQWRTVLSNIYLGLEIQNKLTTDNIEYANELLKSYGLSDFKDYYPSQLSGGMRQRVALIRTLTLKPELLLLDEPFSALDYQTRLRVSDEVYRILKKENKTVILVTHDLAEAISMGDKVIVLSERPSDIKNIIPINFDIDNRTPFTVRKIPQFQDYFDIIWKELNVVE